MKLNGWNRLYLFLLVLICVPLLAIWLHLKPSDGFATYSCEGPYYATRAEAADWLQSNEYKEREYSAPACMLQLKSIATGEAYDQAMREWWNSLWAGAITMCALFVVIYLVGLGIGWVWRGFLPPKVS